MSQTYSFNGKCSDRKSSWSHQSFEVSEPFMI